MANIIYQKTCNIKSINLITTKLIWLHQTANSPNRSHPVYLDSQLKVIELNQLYKQELKKY